MARRPPVVHKRYPSLPRSEKYPLQEFRVRIIEYPNSPILFDLREFVTSEQYTDYTPKGVCLTRQQFEALFELGPDILKEMDK